jgi:FMN reductase
VSSAVDDAVIGSDVVSGNVVSVNVVSGNVASGSPEVPVREVPTPVVRVATVSAGLNLPSATSRLVRQVRDQVELDLARAGAGITVTGIEVRDFAVDAVVAQLGGPVSPELRAALDAVEQADLLIVGTPVFRGSGTGMFHTFFELVDRFALVSTPVLVTATGGSARNAAVVDHDLRPLFAAFGAAVLPTGVYRTPDDCTPDNHPSEALEARIARASYEAARLTARPLAEVTRR